MASGANASDRSRLEQARLKLQKTAARRRVEQKAKQNARQRRAYQRKQKIDKKVGEVKGAASAAGAVAGTVPGASIAKKGAKITKSLAGTVSGAVASAGSAGGGTLRQQLKERASSAPIELEHGYEPQENGEPLGWYRAGKSGQKYYYVPGNEASRQQAKQQARSQMPPPGERAGGLPSLRELAGHGGVDESFMTMGLRTEYDPMPPVKGRPGDEPLPTVGGVPGFTGAVGFHWGGMGAASASERAEGEAGGMAFRWGEETEEGGGVDFRRVATPIDFGGGEETEAGDSDDPFAGFGGGFSWGDESEKKRDKGGWSW